MESPSLESSVPRGKPTPPGVTAGQRIAGLVLIINGGFVLAESRIMPSDGLSSPGPAGIDILLGILLLVGVVGVVPWVKVRVVLGALVFTGLYVVQSDMLMVGLQLAFSAALMLLLFGSAGGVRIAFAGLAATALFTFEVMGLQQHSTGQNPLNSVLLPLTYDLQPIASSEFRSSDHPYALTLPAAGWQRRSEASARADNPLADLWLVQPDLDAHLLVIAESVDPGYEIELEPMVKAVIENATAASPDLQVTEQKPLVSRRMIGRRIDAEGSVEGMSLRYRYGVFARGRHGFQLICFSHPASFETIAPQCDEVLASFRLYN